MSSTARATLLFPALHRGTAVGDLDNDGRMDVVVSVLNGPAKLFHDVMKNGNYWLLLPLGAARATRMAIGAQIKLTTLDGA